MSLRSRMRIRTRLRDFVHRIRPPEPRPLILMYHRIADKPVDFFQMAVSPVHFKEHLDVLRRSRRPLPLNDFVRHLLSRTLPLDAVALTFDDGYVDNLVEGKPLLAAAEVPATAFLPTGYIDRPESFWSDELEKLILLADGPQSFELMVRGESLLFDFGTESAAREDGTTPASSLKRRYAALLKLWGTLRLLEDEERRLIMAKLRSIFTSHNHCLSLGRAMTADEVRALAADGLVTIGAHTVTHPVLTGLGAAACRRESIESKLACEAMVGVPIAAFAYPYGDFDAQAREAVRAAGFTIACSSQRGPAIATSDALALPRILISNMDGDEFERALRLASAG
jgi:peptidoglycan/xylan/chitin deacetylase (PgdA/CDA1 family)